MITKFTDIFEWFDNDHTAISAAISGDVRGMLYVLTCADEVKYPQNEYHDDTWRQIASIPLSPEMDAIRTMVVDDECDNGWESLDYPAGYEDRVVIINKALSA